MKSTIVLVAMVLMGFVTKAADRMDKWPELRNFHEVMAGTFHPSQEGKLEPIKSRIGEFATKAHILATSKIPAEFNNEKVKDAVSRLDKGSVELQTMIAKKATDAEIKAKLSALHDNFHEIVGLCSKGGNE